MADAVSSDGVAGNRVAAVRRFNRFYTRRIGALGEGHLHSPFSLAEVRVLYELAHRMDDGPAGAAAGPTAAEIGRALGLDAGYLSRMLGGFARRGLVERAASARDGRQHYLRLTEAGRATFAELDARARDDVTALLAPVDEGGQRQLLEALRTVEAVLGAGPAPATAPAEPVGATPPFVLRAPRPGDLGWVVARHGALYDAEYGWDVRFEALVARIVADFGDGRDPARERCWIAEQGGERVGSVFLVRHPERPGVAKLRLLLVEPSARGLGVGRALVEACAEFARAAGYHTITLWTNSVLLAARRIYAAAGYRLVSEQPHHSFGRDLVAEVWELAL